MIKEKRKLKNYTQEEMAQILGVSLRQYVRIDNEEEWLIFLSFYFFYLVEICIF